MPQPNTPKPAHHVVAFEGAMAVQHRIPFPARPPGVELALRRAADKADRRRFSGESITGFGELS
jgi:hypothetical protein